jgi:hypothetical protein
MFHAFQWLDAAKTIVSFSQIAPKQGFLRCRFVFEQISFWSEDFDAACAAVKERALQARVPSKAQPRGAGRCLVP